jgi:hypothetical protein
VNLDFDYAYRRVCLPFVDTVPEAMAFGNVVPGSYQDLCSLGTTWPSGSVLGRLSACFGRDDFLQGQFTAARGDSRGVRDLVTYHVVNQLALGEAK